MKTIQIRGVPERVHRALKTRAAGEGRSLSEFALAELTRSLERPTRAEMAERLAARTTFEVPGGSSAAVRAGREAR